MRILFLSDNFPPEGNAPASRLWEHATRWVRAGHDVTVMTCAPNFPEGKLFPGYRNGWRTVEMLEGIRVVRVKSFITANEGFLLRTMDYLSFMVMAFVMSLRERKPDVVVATSPQFFCAVAGWAVAGVKGRPFVFEVRDLWPASITAVGAMKPGLIVRMLEKIELGLYRRAARIVTVTGAFRDDLVQRGVAADKIDVVINGVDLENFSPRPKNVSMAHEFRLTGRFVVGYLGTHGMAHALPKVLEAAARLRHRTDIAFVFAGAGAERSTVEQIVTDQRLDNVHLIPRQPKERMPDLWSLCDVALTPLRDKEVFATVLPSKIFESMGMGVPILLSVPEGEATRLIRQTGAGVCVPPEDPQSLAQAIETLADAPERMSELRKLARQAASQFSRDTLAEQMTLTFDRVTQSR